MHPLVSGIVEQTTLVPKRTINFPKAFPKRQWGFGIARWKYQNMIVERNKRIVGLREQGMSFNDISRELGISVGHVNMLYYKHCAKPTDEAVPDGMSVLTARHVKAMLGVWPSPATAEIISRQFTELLRRPRRRRAIVEVNNWLEALGHKWGMPAPSSPISFVADGNT